MNDITVKISLDKIVDLALAEYKVNLKAYLTSVSGTGTADLVDGFIPSPPSILTALQTLSD